MFGKKFTKAAACQIETNAFSLFMIKTEYVQKINSQKLNKHSPRDTNFYVKNLNRKKLQDCSQI